MAIWKRKAWTGKVPTPPCFCTRPRFLSLSLVGVLCCVLCRLLYRIWVSAALLRPPYHKAVTCYDELYIHWGLRVPLPPPPRCVLAAIPPASAPSLHLERKKCGTPQYRSSAVLLARVVRKQNPVFPPPRQPSPTNLLSQLHGSSPPSIEAE